MQNPTLCAGVPATSNTLLWKMRFLVGDPVAYLEFPDDKGTRSVLILRDIEMKRAKQYAHATEVRCPADFEPKAGLSGDRETATAQAAAECFLREGVTQVVADRSLPLIYHEYLQRAGVTVTCDPELWVQERRQKSAEEIEHLREAQAMTERAMQYACELVANAEADSAGVLHFENEPLTSERVRFAIDQFLMERNYLNPTSIVAGGSQGADCHNVGSGALKTEQPVIIDIFPQNRSTRYWGDCTRTVVHGEIPPEIARIHKVVKAAKAAGTETVRAGVTGEDVHKATIAVVKAEGFETGLPTESDPLDYCGMTHGSGHGIGLDVHEPPLLDFKGPELLCGDALTIEPGLYRRDMGGVRVEDMIIVTNDGCLNLNSLSEELCWK